MLNGSKEQMLDQKQIEINTFLRVLDEELKKFKEAGDTNIDLYLTETKNEFLVFMGLFKTLSMYINLQHAC